MTTSSADPTLVLRRLDELLGAGPDSRQSVRPIETTLREEGARAAQDAVAKMVDWLVAQVDDPAKRLPIAEKSGRACTRAIGAQAELTRQRLLECTPKRAQLREQLMPLEQVAKTGGGRWLAMGRRGPNAELPDKLLQYANLRLTELLLENTLEVLRRAGRTLAEFVQELVLSREKIDHFAETFGLTLTPTRTPAVTQKPPDSATELLPGGARSLTEAAEQLVKRVGEDFVSRLDGKLQEEILAPAGGLWALLTRTRDLAEALTAELQRRGQGLLIEAIKNVHSAGLFLESHPEPDEARQNLRPYVERAVPRLSDSLGWQHLVIGVPPDPAGESVQKLASAVLRDVPMTSVPTEGDIVFCCEGAHLPLPAIAAALIEHEGTYAELARRVLTRIDVTWKPLPALPLA